MLKIRLTRTGKKKQPNYRIVVAEHSAPIQGKFVEIIGNYNPFTKKVFLDKEKVEKWLKAGAKPSNTVAKILEKEGFKHDSIVIKKFKAKSKTQMEAEKKQKEEEKAKEQAAKEAQKAEFEAKVEEEKAKAEENKPEAEAQTEEKPAEDKKDEKPKENADQPPKEEGAAPNAPAKS